MGNINQYIWQDCKAIFDEPGCRVEREVHDWVDGKPTEYLYFAICPECGSDDIEEYCEEEDE